MNSLKNKMDQDDGKLSQLEDQVAAAKLLAEESDRKYEESSRKLALLESDLERAEERAEISESKIVELEEEVRVVSNNLKSLEASEVQASKAEESYADQVLFKEYLVGY